MPTKVRIIEQIGAKALLLPELISRGLAANDRLKYYLALLQLAAAHAASPAQALSNLREEREASGCDDPALDDVVRESRSVTPGVYVIPCSAHIFELMAIDLLQMLEPLRVAAAADPELHDRFDAYERRVNDRIAHLPRGDDDQVPASALDALTRRTTNGHDSLHQLVMDLHWELNHLYGHVSIEAVAGARVYGLNDGDRALVQAFMKGVNTTAALKFDHEGLGTTAVRDGDRLTIQNDLGTNDVHVVVIHVTGNEATVLYTDAHRSRAAFLQQMLESFHVQWDTAPPPSGGYEMRLGRYTAVTREDLERYLTFLGSRLVFLIDWNRARKRLARLVKPGDATMLLKWAADNDIGHRAFLQSGGVRLVYKALERAAPRQLRVGVRLDELLGRESARAFLMSVLSIASAGLASHRSPRLIDDEIEAELLTHLQTTDQTVLTAVADHAALVSALSDRLHGALMRLKGNGVGDDAGGTAEIAKAWEQRSADILQRATRLLIQGGDGRELMPLLKEAGAIGSALEYAAFRLTLVPEQTDRHGVALLDDLADLCSQGARDYVRCIEDARDVRRTPTRSDMERFLVAVDRLRELEQQAHSAERTIEGTLMHGSGDFRQVQSLSGVARSFHDAIGALARCSVIVRDYVLSSTAGGK